MDFLTEPKLERVDLDKELVKEPQGYAEAYFDGYNRALHDIKTKYGELYAEVKE